MPFTAKQIKSGIRSEKIKQEDLVGRSEAGPWKEVRSVLPQEKSAGPQPGASDVTVVEGAPVVPDSSLADPPAKTLQPADSPVSSASDDGTVKIWDARPWTPELLAHAQARRVLKKYRQQVESLEKLRAQLRDAKHLSGLARGRALEWSELFWINRE